MYLNFNYPEILGILNITEDSFSDGGNYLQFEKALAHSLNLIKGGADIIDIGAAASHPHAKKISFEKEIERLDMLYDELKKRKIKISIDSFQPNVQKYFISKKVEYLNDTSGFSEEMYSILEDAECKLIVMYSLQKDGLSYQEYSEPKKVYNELLKFFEKKINSLYKSNISKDRIILDTGMGFFLGKNVSSSIYILQKLNEIKYHFKEFPMLISVSRKSFLGELTATSVHEREASSLSAELFACLQGINFIRTHSPKNLKNALEVWKSLFL